MNQENNNNDNNIQQPIEQTNQTTKPMEPVVLGELKKEKSSKPIFVLVVFVLILGTLFGLPYLQDNLSDTTNFLGRLFNQFFGEEEVRDPETIITKDTIVSLSPSTVISYDNIRLSRINLDGNTMTYFIQTTGESIQLDTLPIYLEIYGANENLLRRSKLTGLITNEGNTIEVNFNNFNTNPGHTYFGRIRTLTDDIYPEFTADTLKCIDGDHTYTYNFSGNNLVSVNHQFRYPASNLETYLEKLNFYKAFTTFAEDKAGVEIETREVSSGLRFNLTLELDKISVDTLGEYLDFNYYSVGMLSKRIKYEMETKEYNCS